MIGCDELCEEFGYVHNEAGVRVAIELLEAHGCRVQRFGVFVYVTGDCPYCELMAEKWAK